MGPSNITSLLVNNLDCTALLDSGSQVCTITEDFCKILGLHPVDEPLKIAGADGNNMSHQGKVYLSLKFLDQLLPKVPTLVVPTTKYRQNVPLLIGTNVIRVVKSLLRQIHGDTYLDVLQDQSPSWHAACSLLQAERDTIGMKEGQAVYHGPHPIVLPPGEESIIVAQVNESFNDSVLVESTTFTDTPGGIGKASVLTKVTDGTVPVRVCNLRDKPVVIRKNMRLADVTDIAESDVQPLQHPSSDPPTEATASAHIHSQTTDEHAYMPTVDLSHLSDMNASDLKQVEDLLLHNADVFSQTDMDFGHTDTVTHAIPLVDPVPFRLPHRRIPPAQYQEVREHLQEMEAAGAIRPSTSPYASQMVLVRKKDGSLRICVDYRQLNLRTVRDAFPLPRIEEALDSLSHAKYFSSLDLTSGYWQVEVAEDDKCKTAFATPMGLYECNRMPFGLQNAPATFQRLMMTCFSDLNLSSVLIYLDDIIVFSSTVEEHIQRLNMVFQRLREHGLKLKPSKCHILQEKVHYLGHVVSGEGISTDPEKIAKVKDWKTPSSSKEVQQFLGFAGYYRRFIKGYSHIAAPLYALTSGDPKKKKKGQKQKPKPPPFQWTPACEDAFTTLKDKLTSSPVLGYADFSLPFTLETDASGQGLGAVLTQVQDGQQRVIAYASRGLRPSETRYPAHKLEYLAVKWAVTDKFRDYLLGRHFTIITDNNALLYVKSSAKLEAIGQRWQAALAEFDYTIKYRPGKHNDGADALSRMPHQNLDEPAAAQCSVQSATQDTSLEPPGTPTLPTPTEIEQEQMDDSAIRCVIEYLHSSRKPNAWQRRNESPTVQVLLKQWDKFRLVDNILYRVITIQGDVIHQTVLPESLRKTVFQGIHADMGHLSGERTIDLARRRFYWPKMTSDILEWCSTCERCCLRKTPSSTLRAPLTSIHTTRPLELLCMDFLKLERSKGGFENILVITDHFTRYAFAYPTADQKATTVAKILWEKIFQHFGLPEKLHSDQGRDFEANIIQQLCRLLKVRKTRTSPYHPQGNGTTERYNRTLLNMLGTLESSQKANWKDHVGAVTHAYNNTKHDSTGYAPFYLMFGRHARIPVDFMLGLQPETPPEDSTDDYVKSLQKCLEDAYNQASSHALKAKDKQQHQYNKKVKIAPIRIGDRVLLQNKSIRGKAKLADKWEATPYVVVDIVDTLVTIKRDNDNVTKRVHRNMVTPCMFLPLDEPLPRKRVTWAPQLEEIRYFEVNPETRPASKSDHVYQQSLQRGRVILNQWREKKKYSSN